MLFQIKDDILDYTSKSFISGKSYGNDIKEGKINLPLLLALKKMTFAEKNFTYKVLRSKKTKSSDIIKVFNLIEKYKGLNNAELILNKFSEDAKKLLLTFNKNKYRDIIMSFIDYLNQRKIMRISKKTIENIFSVATIEDVISDFVSLKKTGANYKGLSPFNEEKTPSFVVSPTKEIWKDFSSGKGGNLVSFLMEHEQFSYPEALTYLAKKYNIEIEYDNIGESEKNAASERESTIAVLSFVKSQFCENLINAINNPLNYLLDRGFKNSTIQEFEIGYSLNKRSDIAEKTKKAGYNIKFLQMANVVNENLNCRFSGRIIFPIHGITGQVLGFGGRLIDDKIKAAKYVNSDSSEIYQKSKILYGFHIAKYHIKNLTFAILLRVILMSWRSIKLDLRILSPIVALHLLKIKLD